MKWQNLDDFQIWNFVRHNTIIKIFFLILNNANWFKNKKLKIIVGKVCIFRLGLTFVYQSVLFGNSLYHLSVNVILSSLHPLLLPLLGRGRRGGTSIGSFTSGSSACLASGSSSSLTSGNCCSCNTSGCRLTARSGPSRGWIPEIICGIDSSISGSFPAAGIYNILLLAHEYYLFFWLIQF